MQNSQIWWNKTKNDKNKLNAWLLNQAACELQAESKIKKLMGSFGMSKRQTKIVDMICEDEGNHATWLLELCLSRGVQPKQVKTTNRYWKKAYKFKNLDEAFGVAAHAEMNALFSALRSQSNVRESVLYCTTYPCHNCCKHLISAGVREVVYLEPYKKSSAVELHGHEITHNKFEKNTKVLFRSFLGVTHNRFEDLFGISSVSGAQINRKNGEDKIVEFPRKTNNLRYPLNSKIIRKLGIILSETLTKDNRFDTHMYKDFIKIRASA